MVVACAGLCPCREWVVGSGDPRSQATQQRDPELRSFGCGQAPHPRIGGDDDEEQLGRKCRRMPNQSNRP